MKLVVCLPALNEEKSVGKVLAGIPSSIVGVSEIIPVVVDDGSTDQTARIAEEAGAWVVRHAVSKGVGGAFHSAVIEALTRRADLLVTLDADAQFDPAEIPEVIAPIIDGTADFVTGTRFNARVRPENMPRLKYWGNRQVARIVGFLTGLKLSDVSCGFRAYSREALLHLNLFGRFTYTQETILDLVFKELRLEEVPVSVRYFPGRRSRVAGSVVRYALNVLKIMLRTVRDFRPLRFFGTAGLVLFAAGLCLDGWLVRYYLKTGSFSPYKIVGFAGLVLNIAGILFIGLGLVADMLDRMRANQEKLLYFEKRRYYGIEGPGTSGPHATDSGRRTMQEVVTGERKTQEGAGK